MLIVTPLTLLLATISSVFADATPVRTCGTTMSKTKMATAERHFTSNMTITQVYWHVISQDSTAAGGNVPDSQIASQITTLNTDYGGNIAWTLAGTTRTVNSDWFKNVGPSSSQQTAMKAALRSGGKGDLNVYSVGFTSGAGAGLLGYSTYPISYAGAPKDDGIVILFSSVPGGSTTGYNLGRTLTHESGHWLGLYHTFQGGCVSSNSAAGGDYVADTPSEASATSGCPATRDTCTGTAFPGSDPFHNFMDYSTDVCMNQFTAGQIARATAQFATYRV
ncbi:metalloprotease [Mycena vulgaris]|nr:metalloprotease [Mycena vulgaris]